MKFSPSILGVLSPLFLVQHPNLVLLGFGEKFPYFSPNFGWIWPQNFNNNPHQVINTWTLGTFNLGGNKVKLTYIFTRKKHKQHLIPGVFQKKQPPNSFPLVFVLPLLMAGVTPRFTSRSKEGTSKDLTSRSKEGKERFGTDRRPFHKCSNSVDLGKGKLGKLTRNRCFLIVFLFVFLLHQKRKSVKFFKLNMSSFCISSLTGIFWRYSHGCAFSGVFWYNPLKTNMVHLKSTKLKSGKSSEPNLYFGAPC